MTRNHLAASGALALASAACAGDFADRVVDYSPAPGQFINNPQFNDPSRALGPPVGGGTDAADNTKLVSLGGFGGSITLAFDPPVLDDPRNPMGLDAIVFGNASWVGGDPRTRFAEAGVIEISRDANGNGLADDAWFVIPGSSIPSAPGGAPAAVHAALLMPGLWALLGALAVCLTTYRLVAAQPAGAAARDPRRPLIDLTFAALADPTRRALVARLAKGEATVMELAEPFQMSQPAISKHLKVLERAGLISRGRSAQWRPCRLESEPLEQAARWLQGNREQWEAGADRLAAFLEADAKKRQKP